MVDGRKRKDGSIYGFFSPPSVDDPDVPDVSDEPDEDESEDEDDDDADSCPRFSYN